MVATKSSNSKTSKRTSYIGKNAKSKKTTITSKAIGLKMTDKVKVKRLSKQVLEKAIQNFNTVNRKKYKAFLKLMPIDDDEELPTEPPIKPKYLNNKGQIPEWIRGRSVFDKTSKPFEHLVRCPYELCDSWFVTWANNRLTVYSDDVFDGQFRPQFTFFNIDVIPLKSQVDVYKNFVQKKTCVSASDWLGNDEEVQLLIGDVSGTVVRVDLQQRQCPNKIRVFDDSKIVTIRTHYSSNVFAVLGANNEIKVYVTPNLWDSDEPNCVAHAKIKPDVVDIFWSKEKLYCLTENEIIHVKLDICSKLVKKSEKIDKPEKCKWEILYTPKTKKSDNKMAKVKMIDDEFVLIQRKDGTLEEHEIAKQEITNTVKNPILNIKYDYALHNNKRVLACGGSNGELIIVNYKTGATIQHIKKRGNGIGDSTNIFWSNSHRDNIILTFGSRVVRYNPKYDRLLNSKPASLTAYFNCGKKGLKFVVRPDAMDQTNIDHDHRAYQWNWGHGDAISTKKTDFTTERGKKLKKILKADSIYQQYLVAHINKYGNKGNQPFALKHDIIDELGDITSIDTEELEMELHKRKIDVGKRKHSPDKIDRKKQKLTKRK